MNDKMLTKKHWCSNACKPMHLLAIIVGPRMKIVMNPS